MYNGSYVWFDGSYVMIRQSSEWCDPNYSLKTIVAVSGNEGNKYMYWAIVRPCMGKGKKP